MRLERVNVAGYAIVQTINTVLIAGAADAAKELAGPAAERLVILSLVALTVLLPATILILRFPWWTKD